MKNNYVLYTLKGDLVCNVIAKSLDEAKKIFRSVDLRGKYKCETWKMGGLTDCTKILLE